MSKIIGFFCINLFNIFTLFTLSTSTSKLVSMVKVLLFQIVVLHNLIFSRYDTLIFFYEMWFIKAHWNSNLRNEIKFLFPFNYMTDISVKNISALWMIPVSYFPMILFESSRLIIYHKLSNVKRPEPIRSHKEPISSYQEPAKNQTELRKKRPESISIRVLGDLLGFQVLIWNVLHLCIAIR